MKKFILLYLLIFQSAFLFAQETEVAHEKNMHVIIFSPDNRLVITGADDKTVKIWDASTGAMQKSFKHGYQINKIFISRDGSHMVTGNGNFYHCLWDLRTGKAVRCFLDQQMEGFTPDGKYLIAIGYGNDGHKFANIGLIDIETFERIDFPHKIPVDTLVHDLAMSSDSKTFLVATGNKNLYVLYKDDPEKKIKHKLKNETSYIVLSPDNKFFVTQGSKHIYDVENYKPIIDLEEPIQPAGVSSLRCSNDGKLLLSVYSNCLDLISLDSGKTLKKHVFNDVKTFGVSNDGKYVAYTRDGKRLLIRDLSSDSAGIIAWDKDLVEQRAFSNYMRGLYFQNAGLYPEAVKYFTAAINNQNYADQIYHFRGLAYMKAGKLAEAVADFHKDYEKNPGRASIDLARAYALKIDLDRSAAYLREHINSKSMGTLSELEKDSLLDNLKQDDKRWNEVVREYKKTEAEKLADKSLDRLARNDKMAAMEFINQAIQKEPKNARWYKIRAELNMNMKQYDKAINDYKMRADLDSSAEAEVYLSIAKAMAKKGELSRAAFMLSKSIERDSTHFSYLLDIASLRYTTFQKQDAMKAVNHYIDIIPNDPYGFYIRARICDDSKQSREDIDQAISLFQDTGVAVPAEIMDFKRSLD